MTNPRSSARGFEQARIRSPCMRETSKRPTIECKRPSRASWLLSRAWNSTAPRFLEIEKSLQERRNHLELLHRQAAVEASHGPEATQLQVLVPDGINMHLLQEAKDSLKKAADLDEEERKAEAAAREAASRPTKEAMELDEFGDLDDREVAAPDPIAEARIQASIDEILQAQTRGDPERLVPKKKPKQG